MKRAIDLAGLVAIVGNYGSGKTEISINLAVNRRRAGLEVRIADLDLVNPYFRTREAKDTLEVWGIDVVLPPNEYLQADLPILSPLVAGLIRQPAQLTLLDVGGNDVGARVLATLKDAFQDRRVRMLQVVNPLRPGTSTLKGCRDIQAAIEKTAGMAINGYIGNANLIDETTAEEVTTGYAFVKTLSEERGLPLEFITVPREISMQIDPTRFDCPILVIDRQLVPPWKKAQTFQT